MSDDDWSELPSDVPAEQWVLAAMLRDRAAIDAAVEVLAPEHFYRPAHQVIYHALVMMFAADEPIDPMTVTAWIAQDGDSKALGGSRAGEYLLELWGIPAYARGVPAYARQVLTSAVRRTMAEEAQRLLDASRSPVGDPADLMAATIDRIAAMASASSRQRPTALSLGDFMAAPTQHPNPVIPGLLDHQDRVIVVGGEGAGKTTLGHQIGFCAAAGVHPFVSDPIPPQRVLIMDMENPQRLLQRRFERLIALGARYPHWDPGNMRVWAEPGGINLGAAREAFQAAEVVRQFAPDLIVAGPLYKLMQETGDNPEMTHGRVARWFDQMRSRYGCALWIEHHAPLGGQRREMRPMGSGIWSRWPEFGIALVPATRAHGGADGLEFTQFRGHREEGRAWPSWISRNRMGGWPWQANYDRDVFTPPLPVTGEAS